MQRLHLKEVLLEAAELRHVTFGARCLGYVHANGRVIAAFEDKSQVEADYLIACDGAGSAIRQQLVGDHQRYLGLVSIHAEAPVEIDQSASTSSVSRGSRGVASNLASRTVHQGHVRVKRGREAVLESRGNARRFHETSSFARGQRDLVFRVASLFIRLFRKRS